MNDVQRLRQVLETKGLTRLMDRLARRLERGRPLAGTLTLDQPTGDEREAIDRLLGRPPTRGGSIHINLERLDAIVRNGGLADGLSQAVEVIRGSCSERRCARQVEQSRWAAMWASAGERVAHRSELASWLESLRRDGTLRRLVSSNAEAGGAVLDQAIDVLERLPCDGMLLTELAASVCGNSHTLDHGEPVCTLVLRALASLRGGSIPADPGERRALWEHFGIACDELSAPVLVLNVQGVGTTCLARALRIHAEAGEPYRISTRQLLREAGAFESRTVNGDSQPPGMAVGGPGTVFVCENVSVLAAAAQRHGPRCPPLVCLDGTPKTAARLLLARLREQGARLLYHGDFDWGGIGIANLIHARHQSQPWRMSATDYTAHCGRGSSLRGQPVVAMWDPDLTQAMQRQRRAVHEELVLELLLHDLAQAAEGMARMDRRPVTEGH